LPINPRLNNDIRLYLFFKGRFLQMPIFLIINIRERSNRASRKRNERPVSIKMKPGKDLYAGPIRKPQP